ncbi:DUF4440 domain-containing protein [Lysobacter niastensis]|uniref:DUF4440 domain-containing protein n=1 Tax=Lysobacter niastensis TaxID=380629 RepID=A0ABS0BBD7_9GAMM|nr:DUF4440 domain-containing protein [Lysobacter niastensis]MBF6025041.1 DUF4440 domain-containing protein [Lysobacter niastensis]
MRDQRDRDKIDALIGGFFSAFDNRGAAPELHRVIDCFTDKAVIVCRSAGQATFHTPLEFALPRIELLTRGALADFHEFETSESTSIFDGIASRTSRYRKAGKLNGEHYSGSGTKCFHLVEVGGDWRISSLAWVDDDA